MARGWRTFRSNQLRDQLRATNGERSEVMLITLREEKCLLSLGTFKFPAAQK